MPAGRMGAVGKPQASSFTDPTSIAGLGNWYDATDASTFTYNTGVEVSQWRDKSGNSRTLLRYPGTTTYPTRNGTMNSLTTVVADGVGAWLYATLAATATRTAFVVARKATSAGATSQAFIGMEPNTNAQIFTNTGTGSGFIYYNPVTVLGGTPTSANIFVLRYASTSSLNIRINGGTGTTIDPDNQYSSSTELALFAGRANSTANNRGDYEIGEVIVYESALSLADINAVGGYLSAKWGPTWTTAT